MDFAARVPFAYRLNIDTTALWRGAVLGVVLFMHLALLLALLMPARPWRRTPTAHSTDDGDLRVRLLGGPSGSTAEATPPPLRIRAPRQRRKPHPSAAPAHHVAMPSPPQPTRPLDLSLHTQTDTPTVAYIPGGRGFGEALRQAHGPLSARIPGAYSYIPTLAPMADPRSQGVAGMVRLVLRHLSGVTSGACLNIQHLGTLSKSQLAAHGLLPDDLDTLAVENGCRPIRGHH